MGALQGIAEWFPVSSSAQTFLAMVNLLGMEPSEALNLSFFFHLGSFFAVLVYFRSEVSMIAGAFSSPSWYRFDFRERSSSLASFLFFSTLATATVGIPVYLLLQSALASYSSSANMLVGLALIATGFLLYLSQGKGRGKDSRGSSLKDMLFAGAAQGIAVVPGISRSGITVASLIVKGFHHEEALRISFLMALPAIAGASILESFQGMPQGVEARVLLAGIASSFLFSLLGIKFLLEISKKLRFEYFCWFFGFVALAFSL